MYVSREIYAKIRPFLVRREALAIIGPRQAGKTTFLEHVKSDLESAGKKVVLLSFEKESVVSFFEKNPDDFAAEYASTDVVIIDEFQYARQGGKILKYLYDTTKIKFIVSGSSALEIRFQTGKYMVGRLLTFYLFPFSFREYLSVSDSNLWRVLTERTTDVLGEDDFKPFGEELEKKFREHWEEYIIWGGYPAVVLAKKTEKLAIIKNLFDLYLIKDIRGLLQLATDQEMAVLYRLLAMQIGSLVSYAELRQSTGLASALLKNNLSILQKTFIVDLLLPYFTNKRLELVKSPKVYFYDTGLRNAGIDNFNELGFRADAGHLAENFVLNCLRQKVVGTIRFWRTKIGAEVDFILEGNGEIVPIEVKYSTSPTIGKSMYSFIKKYKPKKAFILTKQTTDVEIIDGCRVSMRPVFYL